MEARTWIVFAGGSDAIRTDETDHLARGAQGGLSYLSGDDLPAYLGVWLAPNGGHYHLYSDYPIEVHRRFGWTSCWVPARLWV